MNKAFSVNNPIIVLDDLFLKQVSKIEKSQFTK